MHEADSSTIHWHEVGYCTRLQPESFPRFCWFVLTHVSQFPLHESENGRLYPQVKRPFIGITTMKHRMWGLSPEIFRHIIYIYIKTLGGLISHISHHPGPPVLLLSPLVSSGPLRSCAGGPFWGQSSQGREPGGESVRTLPTLQGWPSVSGSAWLRFTSFLHLRPPNKVLDLRGVFNLQK